MEKPNLTQVPPLPPELSRTITHHLYEVQGRYYDETYHQELPVMCYVVSDDQEKAKHAFMQVFKDKPGLKVGICVVRSSSARPLVVL